jgi:hypothetical protein
MRREVVDQPWPIRRLANGAIDYDFYRGRARTLRTQAISDALKSLVALFAGSKRRGLFPAKGA